MTRPQRLLGARARVWPLRLRFGLCFGPLADGGYGLDRYRFDSHRQKTGVGRDQRRAMAIASLLPDWFAAAKVGGRVTWVNAQWKLRAQESHFRAQINTELRVALPRCDTG